MPFLSICPKIPKHLNVTNYAKQNFSFNKKFVDISYYLILNDLLKNNVRNQPGQSDALFVPELLITTEFECDLRGKNLPGVVIV